jgi:cytochrome b pre-mRNA-processing protein 3
MVFGLFRRSANDIVIERLYAAIVTASRQPALYADLAIPDTFEGRFESLTLHAVLVLLRLQACPPPGPDMAQHLIDTVFKHLDRTLREMGVGDTTVPKRMKKLAEAFLGRSAAYREALSAGGNALATALARNVYVDARDATDLARYVAASVARLNAEELQGFIDGRVPFAAVVPDAATEITR